MRSLSRRDARSGVSCLCFVEKCSVIMTMDDLVRVWSDFYTFTEIKAVRAMLKGYVPEKRLPMRIGCDKEKLNQTIGDIVNVFVLTLK